MWTVAIGLSAMSAVLWGVMEGHKAYRAKYPHKRRSAASPKATAKSPILFMESDALAIETLLAGSKARTLKIDQDGTSGTLQLTIKRGAK
jgi:hypothetical protein